MQGVELARRGDICDSAGMDLRTEIVRWLRVDDPTDSHDEVLGAAGDLLERVPPERARYLAAFAYLLGRVAAVDLHVGDDERSLIVRLVAEEGALTADESEAVVTLALADARRLGGTRNIEVTRVFASESTREQQMGVLRCLFAVSAADGSVTVREDNEIRTISRELRIEHQDFIRARLQVQEHLAVCAPGPRHAASR